MTKNNIGISLFNSKEYENAVLPYISHPLSIIAELDQQIEQIQNPTVNMKGSVYNLCFVTIMRYILLWIIVCLFHKTYGTGTLN